jgi:hypothetical protein
MTDAIAPALTPEQWADVAKYGVSYLRAEVGPVVLWNGDDGPSVILALANAALPDTDPRKITWAMVDALLCVVQQDTDAQRWGPFDGEIEGAAGCQRLADALASYLPPREAKP